MALVFDKEVSLVLAGEAGQGIDTVTELLIKVIKADGYNVFSTKEYMSRVRGGCNSSSIRISHEKVAACVDKVDFLFALSKDAIKHLEKRISDSTVVFGEKDNLDFSAILAEIGGNIYLNTIIAGVICGIIKVDFELVKNHIQKAFSDKGNDVIEKNILALGKGYTAGSHIAQEKNIVVNIEKNDSVKDEILINGNDAAALGCIAGGCDFISAYPMSPSTGILTYMAKHADDFNIIVEQAEDEIAAINMGIGAWYAGARAMTCTSGGGFDLMVEAVSLCGMLESPMVIYLGQRPGPATGLPTRTEQGDLNIALYSGHGEFARVILAPGTLEDAFYLSREAFNLADEFQVPVFILSDQYFADSYCHTKAFELENADNNDFIEKTKEDYKRYIIAENGVSPRGIPNYGDGLVVVDSDEHDEEGHITEDLDLRVKMVDKRLKKLDALKNRAIPPEFFGNPDYKTLIIGWGSTCNVIKEALNLINNPEIAFLHFKQLHPLQNNIKDYLEKPEKIICIENNATGQFAGLLKLETGISADEKILKYNGLAFSVEELVSKINEVTVK